MVHVSAPIYSRNACGIGDPRMLPYLKDIINRGRDLASWSDDVVLWCNDDVQLDPRIVGWCYSKVIKAGAMSMRRTEPGKPRDHMGRELFAFTGAWLDENWDKIPDFILGCPFFDLILAAIIRKERGIDSTTNNLKIDYPVADAEERYAIHEPHLSSWSGVHEHTFPANIHNKKLAKEWCAAHMPSLKL